MHRTCPRVWRAFVLLGGVLAFSIGISAQTEKILYSFTKGLDGGFPYGGAMAPFLNSVRTRTAPRPRRSCTPFREPQMLVHRMATALSSTLLEIFTARPTSVAHMDMEQFTN
jgi:hypothetical protein